MHDILVVGLFVSMCGAIGLPFSLLLPSQGFAVRWALAPPLGFGLLAAGTAILYLSGVAPWITLLAMAITGLVIAAAMIVRVGRWRTISAGPWPATAMVVAAVTILCLAPGWTGGPRFRIFQADVYDHLLYVGAAISYRTLDYASLVVQGVESAQADPLAVAALWFIDWRAAVSMMHAAFAIVSRGAVVDCAYPYMVGMQLNMLFAALFVFVNVLAMRRWLAWICASALTVGFFEQYIFDINAWSQLATQPIFLLLLAFVALSFPLEAFADETNLAVELATNSVTRFPGDPRDLGFAIRELSVRR